MNDAGVHSLALPAQPAHPDQPVYPAYPEARTRPLDPPAGLGELRGQSPVSRVSIWGGSTTWLVTGHAEAVQALRDDRLSADSRRSGFPFISAAQAEIAGTPPTFPRMDAPDHGRYRRLLAPEFTARRMESMRLGIERIVERILDDLVECGPPADLVKDFAEPLPALVICGLLGVPFEDHAFFEERTRKLTDQAADPADVRAARMQMREYLDRLVTAKTEHPTDDLLGRLASARTGTEWLSHADIVGIALILLFGGFETTAGSAALAVVDLLEHRDQWDLLAANPDLMPSAVEELLRHQTILESGIPRVARTDLEIGGTAVKAGEGVIVSLAAANRDPAAYTDPDRLDLARAEARHVAFGYGVHMCIGIPLARIELQSALSALVRRLPTLRLSKPADQLEFRGQAAVYGPVSLPVEW